MTRTAAVFAALALAAAGGARAAVPQDGSVSAASPSMAWSGEASGAGFVQANTLLAGAGLPILCEPMTCDAFTLRVEDSAGLAIEASSCATSVTELAVRTPDGSTVFADGGADSPRTIVEIPAAPTGTYVVQTLVDNPPGLDSGYRGHARLDIRPPLTVDVPATSADQATRGARLVLALVAGVPLTHLRAEIRDGRSRVADGRRARLSGEGEIAVVLKRGLRPGTYRVAVRARGPRGPVTATAALVVSRPAGVPDAAPGRSRRGAGRSSCYR